MALRDLTVRSGLVLPSLLLSVRFARSGGPGGQNVNKVESKVDLRLDLAAAEQVLGEERTAILRTRLANRIDSEGCLQVVSVRHRDQSRNIEDALTRMEDLLRDALAVRKKRRVTRPTRASKERRLGTKRRRSDIKRQRRDRGEG